MKNNLNTFSERLAYAMNQKGYQPIELSELCNISISLISHYLSRGTIPRHDKLVRMASVLDVSCDWLLGNETNTIKNILHEKHISVPIYSRLLPNKGFFNKKCIVKKIVIDTSGLENGKDYFGLVSTNNDLAEAGIISEDVLIFEKEPSIQEDMIGCIYLNSHIYLRKIVLYNGTYILQSGYNTPAIPVNMSDMFTCLGKLVKVIRNVR